MSLIEEAVRTFVRTAYKHVRVDTGMSRASLRPLAQTLNFDIPIEDESRRVRAGKSISAGMEQQSHLLTWQGDAIIFEWSSSVLQYYLNEQYRLKSNRQSPWYSLVHGNIKAKRFLLEEGGKHLADSVRQSISYIQ